jgi:starch phosphorylase
MKSQIYGNKYISADVDLLERSFAHFLKYALAKDSYTAKARDRYMALGFTVRNYLIERWIETQQAYYHKNVKRVYYLSLEYLMGRSLLNNIVNLGMLDACKEAMERLGLDLEELSLEEVDAGLGNGGLGRLAACFLDSMATLSLPSIGYGLRYDYGIFRQRIKNGQQMEEPDEWLRFRNVWEIERPEYTFLVNFGGHVEERRENDRVGPHWVPSYWIMGVPYDSPVIGYGSDNVNTLRLWSAKASEDFDFNDFNQGDYIAAVRHKIQAENLTKVLYPNDNNYSGKELRFCQQYFFVSCSLQDIVRRFKVYNQSLSKFADKVAVQLNDTHPSLAIAELMRILLDTEHLTWDEAWKITVATFGYTNHTLMPEALEKWPIDFFQRLLPRHLQIIYQINQQFLGEVALRYPGDNVKLSRMSLVEEGPQKQIRMACLATIGSHSINGVSELHTELLKKNLLNDFYDFFPERFNNKTNGITPRRWLVKSNRGLSNWITQRIGEDWIKDLSQLRQLEQYAEDSTSRDSFRQIKLTNKQSLAKVIAGETGIQVDAEAIFDVQVKRIHEYKRQVLNVLHIIMLYNRLKANPNVDIVPRVFIFAGKAAPGYFMAKLTIKLISAVGDVINSDKSIRSKLKVVFLPNYGVSLAEKIMPAGEVSEQISTAGMEASGTGNMKLSLNGALTVGTWDGANIEIAQEVGKENIFIFGFTAEEIMQHKENHSYNPWDIYQKDEEIRHALDLLFSNFFCLTEPGLFNPIRRALLDYGDSYFVLGDLRAYADCQAKAEMLYKDQQAWNRQAILNVARMGKFSSDRVIREYANEIWKVESMPIDISRKHAHTIMQARVNKAD